MVEEEFIAGAKSLLAPPSEQPLTVPEATDEQVKAFEREVLAWADHGPIIGDVNGERWQLDGLKIHSFTFSFDPAVLPPVLIHVHDRGGVRERWAVRCPALDAMWLYRRRRDALHRRGGVFVPVVNLVNTLRVA